MAEGFLHAFNPALKVYSAGTSAEKDINPYAVRAMRELGIDIGGQKPESIDKYITKSFDYVITVCDGAKEVCPVFTGNVKNRLHIGFDDPAAASGSEEVILPVYRRVRDEIKEAFSKFYADIS